MPHLTTLRSLVPSSSFSLFLRNPSLSSPFLLLRPNKPFSLLTPLASSNTPRRRRFTPQRRNTSTFIIVDKKAQKKQLGRESEAPSMEDSNPSDSVAAFNRKRAEGRDKEDLPRKSLQLKVRKLNPINTISYVQILGTGMDTQDTSPSVLLFFDKQRFIFNAGEGLQRFCTEHKIKLSKIDHIFLSRVCSETAGGLPGLLLTLAGMGDQGMSVNVWGPSDLKYLVDAMKCFIPNAAMVHTRSFGPSLDSDRTSMTEHSKLKGPIVLIDDEVVKISAILLQPSFSEGYSFVKETPLEHSGSGPSSPNRKISSSAKPGDMSVVYVCELPEIKGKFDPRKASSLGLRPGPKYRELQLGNSVKSDREDIMIHPSDVMGPSIPGPVVFLIDCPTVSHLQELLSVEYLNRYCPDFSDPLESSKVVSCIIHLSPASVVSRSDYQNWMKRFSSSSTQHIMAGHERKNVEIPILKASARIAARLNYLCPQFFPAPGFWSLKNLGCLAPSSIIPNEVCDKDSDLKLCESLYAENLLKFTLRPYANLGLDKSGVPSLMARTDVIGELLTEIPDIGIAAQGVSQLWGASSGTGGEISPSQDVTDMVEEPWLNEKTLPSCLENVRRDDLEIVLLGTGSSQPSKYRNVSSIHINLFSKGGLLLDCGEGTLGQLKRRYGVEGADKAVKGLRCIWISHIHADHHTGLARILALRHDLLKGEPHEPVLVVGPIQLKRFLDAYQRLEDLDMQFLDCRETLEDLTDKNINGQIAQKIGSTLFAKGSHMQSYLKKPGSPIDNSAAMKSLEKVLTDAGLEALFSFPVVHCSQAYGVMLKAAERVNCVGKVIPGWKVVYSGDTRPCPTLVQASRGATILIHEATFEEGMVEEAIAKNHSTTEEAIDVGNSANAYRIILTHFSQRYPKIPVFDDRHMNNTCIAFDMMSVNLADLPVLPRVLPYLKLLFRNEMVFDESDDVREAINV